jgi:drug/metabolite transporter (DMT)-like permease
MNPVVLGLVAAVCWGVSDTLARTLSRELGAFRAQLWSQAAGFVLLAVAVVVTGAGAMALDVDDVRAWAFAFVYASIIGVAGLVFFEAFGQGRLVVVAPIVGGYGAVTLAWSVAFGARPSTTQWLGFVFAIVGAVISSLPSSTPASTTTPTALQTAQLLREQRGTVFAVLSALLFGTAFFVLSREVAPTLGSLVPALLSRTVGPVCFVAVHQLWRPQTGFFATSIAPPPPGSRWSTLLAGVLASTATVATGLGASGTEGVVVAVLGSLSVVVTVVIGLLLWRERLSRLQWVGVALALAGIPLLALR